MARACGGVRSRKPVAWDPMARLPVAFTPDLWHRDPMERLFDSLLGFLVALVLPAWELPPDFADVRASFPHALTEVRGENTFDRWADMRGAGTIPVILGPPDDALALMQRYRPDAPDADTPSVDEILAAADAIDFPAEMFALNRAHHAAFVAEMKAEDPAFVDELGPPDVWAAEIEGDWPDAPVTASTTLTLPYHWQSGAPHPRVFIAEVTGSDPTALPAHLRFGGWNLNPAPEMHVAAFRHWAAAYGAVPVAMSADVIEMRVDRRPATREAALTLAREMYEYCPDIVDQGTGTLSALAAELMVSDLWYFWWD
jgi:hypothetical protein